MRSDDVTSSAKIASFGERVERTPFSHRFWRSWPVIGCLGRPKGGDKWGNVRMTGSPVDVPAQDRHFGAQIPGRPGICAPF
jgi:hypothetical protein